MRLLLLLAAHPGGVGVSDAARELGLGKSTVSLLLSTLLQQEIVRRTSSGKYELGLGAFYIGRQATLGAPANGMLTGSLRELAEKTGEAVSLAIQHGPDAVIIERVESASLLRAEIRVGTKMPLHASASGKVLLSIMTDDQVDRLFPEEDLPPGGPRAIRARRDLKKQLVEVRNSGFAHGDDEFTEGVWAVAVPVAPLRERPPLALSIAGPATRFDPDAWIRPLLATARRMTELLVRAYAGDTPR